jgi:hypothetical protein
MLAAIAWLIITVVLGVWAVHASANAAVDNSRSDIAFAIGQLAVFLQQRLAQVRALRL